MNQDVTDIVSVHSGEKLLYFLDNGNEFLQTTDGTKIPINGDIICFLNDVSLTGNNRNFQKMYDRLSGFYDLITGIYARFKDGNEKNRVMQYLSLLEIKNEDKVIEISIGTGRNIKYLNPLAHFYGVDISLGMLKRCQKNMRRLKRNIILLQSEAESLPINNETFDVVFSAGGFNFFNDPGKAILEMLRIAKKGAKLLITDETEKIRLKYAKSNLYDSNEIKDPVSYLPDNCRKIEYKEICNGELYVLTFYK